MRAVQVKRFSVGFAAAGAAAGALAGCVPGNWMPAGSLPAVIYDATAAPGDEAYAVGSSGTRPAIYHRVGDKWVDESPAGAGSVTSVSVSGGDAWAAGTWDGTVKGKPFSMAVGLWHRVGGKWVMGPTEAGPVTATSVVALPSGHVMFAYFRNGRAVVESGSSNTGYRVMYPSSPDPVWRELTPMAITGTSSNDVWLTGDATARGRPNDGRMFLAHFDGVNWTVRITDFPHWTVANSVLEISAHDVYIGGGTGSNGEALGVPLVAHFNGASFVYRALPGGPARVSDLVALGPGNIWALGGRDVQALGYGGYAAHFDGAGWLAYPSSGGLLATGLPDGNGVLAVALTFNLGGAAVPPSALLRHAS